MNILLSIANIILYVGPIAISLIIATQKQLTPKDKIIIYSICGVLTICAVLKTIIENRMKKERKKKKKKEREYNDYFKESKWLSDRGFSDAFINRLREKHKLKFHFWIEQKLLKQSYFKEAINELKECLRDPKATESDESEIHTQIGNCYINLSNFEDAKVHYKEAYKLSRRVQNKDEKLRRKAVALGNMGMIYCEEGKFCKALHKLRKALKKNKKIGNKQGIASNLGNMGLIYKSKGNDKVALKKLKEALVIHEEIEDTQGIASDQQNIGLIHIEMDNLDEALENFKKALKKSEEMKPPDKLGIAYQNNHIGVIYREKGEPDKALKYFKKALPIFEHIKNSPLMEMVSKNIEELKKEINKQKDKEQQPIDSGK